MLHGPIPAARFLPYLTWADIAAMPAKADAVIIQPVGSIEQHGPHLPIAVDALIVQGVLGAALARLEPDIACYALPPLCYGKSNEHIDFAGTITLSAGTLLQTLEEIIDSLHRSGFRKIALVNAHGGQRQVIDIAARDARARHRDLSVFPLFIWSVPSKLETMFDARERRLGIHAGAAETALLLALLPEAVRMERAHAEWPRNMSDGGLLSFEGPCRFAWLTHDLSKSGTLGDPTAASQEAGEALLASLAESWAALVVDMYRFTQAPA